jgi:hypothetical protein
VCGNYGGNSIMRISTPFASQYILKVFLGDNFDHNNQKEDLKARKIEKYWSENCLIVFGEYFV